ncbi:MAG: septum formation protein Maf [Chloroflexi bacterium]|nr:septum formation protein Maf [Chloroflexota bacterium]
MIAHPDHSVNATILLASASPRRRELIKLLGLPVETTSTDIDEIPLPEESAAEMAVRLSNDKATRASSFIPAHPLATGEAGRRAHPSSLPVSSLQARRAAGRILLASDTVVSLDGEPLGKPRDAVEARSMLRRLRGRTHQVYTAIALIDLQTDRSITDLACSDVPMRNYTDEEIEAYIASGDPFDKAGAYAIQHTGFHPVGNFSQCFANVMGLPLCHVTRSLRKSGVDVMNDVPALCQAHLRYECPVFESILKSEESHGEASH